MSLLLRAGGAATEFGSVLWILSVVAICVAVVLIIIIVGVFEWKPRLRHLILDGQLEDKERKHMKEVSRIRRQELERLEELQKSNSVQI